MILERPFLRKMKVADYIYYLNIKFRIEGIDVFHWD